MAKRSDWLLLALDAAGSKGLSPVQLQKALFLLGKELPDVVAATGWYDFEPYNYGPFDSAVYSDAKNLANSREAEIVQREGETWNRYLITRDGEVRASYVAREHPKVADYLRRLVAWVQAQTFQSLVSAVYAKYPDMRANSVFQG
jgi:hypothetical protein